MKEKSRLDIGNSLYTHPLKHIDDWDIAVIHKYLMWLVVLVELLTSSSLRMPDVNFFFISQEVLKVTQAQCIQS